MFYLVVSDPVPSWPEDVKTARREFRSWVKKLKKENKVVCFYPRLGRGSIVIFDVSSNDELHGLLTQWLDIVPVSFQVHPLAAPEVAEEQMGKKEESS